MEVKRLVQSEVVLERLKWVWMRLLVRMKQQLSTKDENTLTGSDWWQPQP